MAWPNLLHKSKVDLKLRAESWLESDSKYISIVLTWKQQKNTFLQFHSQLSSSISSSKIEAMRNMIKKMSSRKNSRKGYSLLISRHSGVCDMFKRANSSHWYAVIFITKLKFSLGASQAITMFENKDLWKWDQRKKNQKIFQYGFKNM